MKKYWKYGVVGLLIAGVAIAFMVIPKHPPGPVVPVPNGYDDFVQAGRQAVDHRSLTFGEAEDAELRQIVNDNRSALNIARHGLARRCKVPTDYRFGVTAYWAKHSSELSQVKALALAFRAEGELAQREGRTNDAVQTYLQGIQFGQEVWRGGLLIDRLVGIACEAIALKPLSSIAPNGDARACREITKTIEQMDANREPMRVTWEEEQIWSRHSGNLRERFTSLFDQVFRRKSLQAMQKSAESKVVDLQLRERRLLLQAASRANRLEQKKPAVRAADLVPEYLKAVPKDPVTGAEMTLGY